MNEVKDRIYQLQVGMSANYSRIITDADIKAFANISGDNNPIHMNDEFAEKSHFKKRIAHGLISASFFSAIFGTKLPGPGCVYVSQDLKFLRPVYIGDAVYAEVTIKAIDIIKRRIIFDTVCTVLSKKVIVGKAEIYLPE